MRNRIIVGLLLLAATTGCDKHILSSDERDQLRIAYVTQGKIPNGGTLEVAKDSVRRVQPYNARGEFTAGRCTLINPKDNRGNVVEVARIVGSSERSCNVRGVTPSVLHARLIVANPEGKVEVNVVVPSGRKDSTYAYATD